MRERNEREKPQFSGLPRLLASLCDPYLSIVSVKICHHALFLKIIEVTRSTRPQCGVHIPFQAGNCQLQGRPGDPDLHN